MATDGSHRLTIGKHHLLQNHKAQNFNACKKEVMEVIVSTIISYHEILLVS